MQVFRRRILSPLALIASLLVVDRAAVADSFIQVSGLPVLTTCSSTTGTTTLCPVSGTEPGLLGSTLTFSGNLEAASNYGVLDTGILVDVHDSLGIGELNSIAVELSGSFSDSLVVGGYSGTGLIQFDLDVTNGIVNGLDVVSASTPLNIDGVDVPGNEMITLPFTGGVAFPLDMSFSYRGESLDEGLPFGSYEVSIGQIYVYDSNMHQISGYTLTSGSGTDYPGVGDVSSIPEPASFCLLVTVVLGSAWVARGKAS